MQADMVTNREHIYRLTAQRGIVLFWADVNATYQRMTVDHSVDLLFLATPRNTLSVQDVAITSVWICIYD